MKGEEKRKDKKGGQKRKERKVGLKIKEKKMDKKRNKKVELALIGIVLNCSINDMILLTEKLGHIFLNAFLNALTFSD